MIISIIIATYNAAKNLNNCIESIIAQINNDCELIIIDGNSNDITLEIIKLYSKYINYFISETDSGVYDAWNKGIEMASGDWIMFIGADDILLPNALSTYLALLKNNILSDYDYISAHNEYVDHSGRFLKLLGEGADWPLMRKGMSAAHVGSLHNKKKLFNEVGYYDLKYRLCSDYELLLRKRDNLKGFFLDARIARMKVGGMSFSVKAIKETFEIRKHHHTVNIFFNYLLYFRDIFAYKLFRIKKLI